MTTKKEILQWYLESGVTETIGEVPMNRFHSVETQSLLKETPITPTPLIIPQEQTFPSDSLLQTAVQSASKAETCEQLLEALNTFDGCSYDKRLDRGAVSKDPSGNYCCALILSFCCIREDNCGPCTCGRTQSALR